MFSRKISLFILSLTVLLIGFLIWWNNAYVPVTISFDPKTISEDPDLYLAEQESQFLDIKPGLTKQIIWQNPDTKAKTEYSVVYIHGFSASKDEIRPVPDLVASAIGANIYYTRLPGHARTTASMGGVKVNDYFNNLAEALAIGETIGNKTIVIATSLGGSLVSWLDLTNAPIGEKVVATVLVSPVFELAATGTSLLTYPLAQYYTPLIIGPYRVANPNARFEEIYAWTNAYPANALLPLAETVKLVGSLDAANADLPTMFIYDIRDKTSDEHTTAKFYEAWGAPKHRLLITESVGNHHVIAGDLVNPGNNDLVSTEIIKWLKTMGIPRVQQQ
ncbi:alpha/beta fold hydrolase [Pseudovibrio sp. Tun.PSC04-5.I4]|uniref:alpha/beta hydrolase n=1 Tax=Pseudovibrio sp. Tun.PSC04-5.I4 TaxID=1798213 RepID=UPI00088D7A8B|nr:alpha/beta fold hydrolase [Pseudovibrio sp. Tun.PSC04-5.I4]SDR26709.1 Esterase/lipase [Pseudovibrio sp. Tun.PSC04-5.I4]